MRTVLQALIAIFLGILIAIAIRPLIGPLAPPPVPAPVPQPLQELPPTVPPTGPPKATQPAAAPVPAETSPMVGETPHPPPRPSRSPSPPAEPRPARRPSPAVVLHIVQIAVLPSREAAGRLSDRLRGSGFEPYLVPVGGGYAVRVGAFRERDRALRLARLAAAKGFPATIVERR